MHTLSFSRTLLSAAVAGTFALAAVTASADLSSRYVDNDGDMIADVPSDESQWVDPDTLVFAYTPVEDPAVYADVWAGFLDHLSDATGKNVEFFPEQSNAAQTGSAARRSSSRGGLQHGRCAGGGQLRCLPPLRHDGC